MNDSNNIIQPHSVGRFFSRKNVSSTSAQSRVELEISGYFSGSGNISFCSTDSFNPAQSGKKLLEEVNKALRNHEEAIGYSDVGSCS